jgi:hypothetical protein
LSPRVGFALLIGLLALFAAAKPILFDTLDPDCFWHMRVAAQLHRDGIGPIVDDLSFASTRQPWTPYSWLAELGMKAVWDAGGYRAAVAVTAMMQGMLAVLLAMCCREIQEVFTVTRASGPCGEIDSSENHDLLISSVARTGRRPVSRLSHPGYLTAVVATAIGLFLTLPYLSFRPVTAGFVLLFTIAWLILRDQRLGERSRAVWLIIPLTAVLTNIHLYSIFVPMAVFAMGIGSMIEQRSTVGRRSNRYGYLSFGVTLACLCTPMLPGAIRTAAFYGTKDQMVTGPVIAEMQSFARGPLGFLSAGLLLGILGCVAINRHRLRVGQMICVIGGTLLLFKLGRFAPLFALAACPALAATLPGLNDRLLKKVPVVAALAMILGLGCWRVGESFPTRTVSIAIWLNRHGRETPGYPCAAADFVDHSVARSTGRLINEFSWGGYLSWRLAGRYQVLLDGRTQIYPQSLWQATYLGSELDRRAFLAGIHADAALLPADKSTFRASLIKLGWVSAYRDDRAEVLLPPGEVALVHRANVQPSTLNARHSLEQSASAR